MNESGGHPNPDAIWRPRYPRLFETRTLDFAGVGYGHLSLSFTLSAPPDDLVSNVRVIGLNQGRVVVCSNDLGWRFLPGGTREPGEQVRHTAERELLEEAGAVFSGPMTKVGAFKVHNSADPYRPHLPHPDSYWLYVTADVEIRQPPTNPADGEYVTEVLELPPVQAIEYLAPFDVIMTDTLRLFFEISGIERGSPVKPVGPERGSE
ncbi:MAG: NUDIX domain-containing protein [Propionibacteriaceae bacterium]|nr:NUDIX domain-containing protein [Propionibacteriaceae bacterium]